MKKSLSLFLILPAMLLAIACGGSSTSSTSAPKEPQAVSPENVHQMGNFSRPSVMLISSNSNYRQYVWEEQVKWYSNAVPYLTVSFTPTFVAAQNQIWENNAVIVMEWRSWHPNDPPTGVEFIQWVRNFGSLYSAANGYEEPVPAIAQWTSTTPIVVLTSDPAITAAALAAGATQVIPMETSPEDLAALVDQYQLQRYPCDGDWWLPNCGIPQ